MPETIERCPAETPVELWDVDDVRESGADVRFVRPEGHEGAHSGVITWTDAP